MARGSVLFSAFSRWMGARRKYSGPRGRRLYAVGDIHGRLDLLDDLLTRISADRVEHPVSDAVLVFLGDLIDRGPTSAGVVERVRTLAFDGRVVTLLGNHEEMLLRVLAAEAGVAHDWLGYGGDACVESYGLSPASLLAMSEARIAALLSSVIPRTHVTFLEAASDSVRFGDYLLVHAGIRPGIPLADQSERDLRWIREPFLSDVHDHGCIVVHGHTVTDGVDRRENRVGIDTGAYRTGELTAAIIEEDSLRFVATGSGRG